MRAWLILACLIIGGAPCKAAVEAVNIYEPRAFGYFIGDTFERRIEVVTTGDTELLTAGLPRPGPLTYWLELIDVDHKVRETQGRKIHDITLKYQTFYAPIEAVKVKIPAYPLKFRNPGTVPAAQTSDTAPGTEIPSSQDVASIPAFQIVMSPLREYAVSDFMSGKSVELADIMAPDAKAHAISTSRQTTWLGLGLAALALSALLLLWHYAKVHSRTEGRPFTMADRRIRELQPPRKHSRYRDSLIALHRAFDESYGRRLSPRIFDLPQPATAAFNAQGRAESLQSSASSFGNKQPGEARSHGAFEAGCGSCTGREAAA
uniref:Uncharacterized protein moxA n=1 Tax=Hyphomicrobium denitrificans TaxID=53399 RepID=Q4AE20_9HYPH|nr:hypothetical protein [Hyphomicrobium denitrificans]